MLAGFARGRIGPGGRNVPFVPWLAPDAADAGWGTDDIPAILGRPAYSFERFAAGHASAFS